MSVLGTEKPYGSGMGRAMTSERFEIGEVFKIREVFGSGRCEFWLERFAVAEVLARVLHAREARSWSETSLKSMAVGVKREH